MLIIPSSMWLPYLAGWGRPYLTPLKTRSEMTAIGIKLRQKITLMTLTSLPTTIKEDSYPNSLKMNRSWAIQFCIRFAQTSINPTGSKHLSTLCWYKMRFSWFSLAHKKTMSSFSWRMEVCYLALTSHGRLKIYLTASTNLVHLPCISTKTRS